MTPLAKRLRALAQDGQAMLEISERGAVAKRTNVANRAQVSAVSSQVNRERMSEREFVRMFGDKIKKVRYSHRADYVGLIVLGRFQGFIITSDYSGERKLRLIDVDEQGKSRVTRRFLRVKQHDSISNLQRGLLKWVR
jgi:hypothetical protein